MQPERERKGELFGLRNSDVDLKRRLLMVRRSYDRETTKGAREEAVPIAAALVPFLEDALTASKGALLSPRPDGEMRTEEDKPGKRLRSALNRGHRRRVRARLPPLQAKRRAARGNTPRVRAASL